MNVYIYEDKEHAYIAAAARIQRFLKAKPNGVLGLATGQTMVGLYDRLAALYEAGALSFADAVSFNLDEYVGLPEGHKASYRRFMDEKLFSRIDIRRENTYVPAGVTDPASAQAYDALIADKGGIDFQVLGIGVNGHIGFNEPGTPRDTGTHVMSLTLSTKTANAYDFNGDINAVPDYAVTMGLKTILDAKTIILLAIGASKAPIMQRVLKEQPTEDIPASLLRDHPDTVFILDAAAASELL